MVALAQLAGDRCSSRMGCFEKGADGSEAGRLQEAYDSYKKAWDLKQSPDIACNLGNVEVELKKVRDGAEHLTYCMKTFPATGSADQKAQLQARLTQAREQVGLLKIVVSPRGRRSTSMSARLASPRLRMTCSSRRAATRYWRSSLDTRMRSSR